MDDLPIPVSREDKLLHNIIDGSPNIDDLDPISREEIYLKYIALNGSIGGIIPISKGGTGGTTASTARQNLELLKAFVLYDNDEGNEGTVTLSDNADDYEFLDIIIWDFYLTRVYHRNGRPVGIMRIGGYGGNYIEWSSESISISGNIITRNGSTHARLNENGSTQLVLTDHLPIRTVIGYKY